MSFQENTIKEIRESRLGMFVLFTLLAWSVFREKKMCSAVIDAMGKIK